MSAYCEAPDLMVGDLFISSTTSVERWITTASDEIDSKIGYIYVTPVNITALPPHQAKLLKNICAKLASGRMLMAMAQGSEDNSVHAYALHLVREATEDLMLIANGDADLTAPRVDADGAPVESVPDPSLADPYARIPTGRNADAYSSVTTWEHNYLDGTVSAPDPWIPADNVERKPPVAR